MNYELYLFPSFHHDNGDDHLFHGDAAVLEGVFVIAYVIIIVVRIGKEGIACGEHIAG